MNPRLLLVIILLLLFFLTGMIGAQGKMETAVGDTFVLYDSTLGGTPDTQNLVYTEFPPNAAANQSYSNGVTVLDTTPAIGDWAGYGQDALPTLDRAAGYSVAFTMQVESETHLSVDRAGFAVTVLGNDLRGIQLNFWEDEIWAHEGETDDLFTHAEGAAFDTTADLSVYELQILAEEYTLYANNAPILTGPVRDYTAFEPPPWFPGDPYETPNVIGLGDNTSSAQAKIDLAFAAIETNTNEPATPTPTPTTTSAPTATPTATPPVTPTITPSPTAVPLPENHLYLPAILR